MHNVCVCVCAERNGQVRMIETSGYEMSFCSSPVAHVAIDVVVVVLVLVIRVGSILARHTRFFFFRGRPASIVSTRQERWKQKGIWTRMYICIHLYFIPHSLD